MTGQDQPAGWQRADGTGGLERLTTPEEGMDHIPDAFSPDGETLSFTAVGKDESAVWMLALQEQETLVSGIRAFN